LNSAGLLLQVVKAVQFGRTLSRRETSDICRDLRFIRFNDQGVLNLIDQLIAGEAPEVPPALLEFCDYDSQVAQTADRLLHESGNISRLRRDDVQLIGWRKPQIRSDVKELVLGYGQADFIPNIEELMKLRTGINDLNAAIDEVEDLLMRR